MVGTVYPCNKEDCLQLSGLMFHAAWLYIVKNRLLQPYEVPTLHNSWRFWKKILVHLAVHPKSSEEAKEKSCHLIFKF